MEADGDSTQATAYPEPYPFYFGPVSRRLFGWYYAPNPDAKRNIAVVLCRPIGYEAVWTFAPFRYLAEHLAERGYSVLRFDYDGTGDSAGSDDDPERVSRWIGSIGAACDTLRSLSGMDEIALFGVRMGGTLAAFAALERDDIHSLILWSPCRSGRSFLREMRALHGTHEPSNTPEASDSLPQESPCLPLPDDFEESAGFIYTRETIDALNALDATKIESRPAPRALLIARDDLPEDKRIGARLEALGVDTTRAAWPGYAEMVRDPVEIRIPVETIDRIAGWLDEQSQAAADDPPPTLSDRKLEIIRESPVLETPEYLEMPVQRDGSQPRFGILTLPAGAHAAPGRITQGDRPLILLLPSGANPHVGPGRSNVQIARLLAAAGFASLRLDTPGLGDSIRGGVSTGTRFYAGPAIEDVLYWMDYFEAKFGVNRFGLAGLCSGAYVAYCVSTMESRVATQILINQPTYKWEDGDSMDIQQNVSYKPTRVYMSQLPNKGILRRVLKRQVDVKGISKILIKRINERAENVLKSTMEGVTTAVYSRRFETDVLFTFRQIAAQGTKTLLLFAEYDYGREVAERRLGTGSTRRLARLNMSVSIVPDADHTFTQRIGHDRMIVSIRDYLTKNFPAGAPVSHD